MDDAEAGDAVPVRGFNLMGPGDDLVTLRDGLVREIQDGLREVQQPLPAPQPAAAPR